MQTITIHIKDPRYFSRLLGDATRTLILQAAARSITNTLRAHFRARQAEPEQITPGFPKYGQSYGHRGFWSATHGGSVAERILPPAIDLPSGTITISINSPALKHKINPTPPPITPKGDRKYLAIPATPLAAQFPGMPRDFPTSMKFGYATTPDGKQMPALIASDNYFRRITRGKRTGAAYLPRKNQTATHGATQPIYWLVRQVQTPHDPNALPPDSTIHANLTQDLTHTIKAITTPTPGALPS